MRVIITILLSLILSQAGTAQSNSSTAFRFLELTPTARAAALGGNHIALYDADFSLFHLNPAYLNDEADGKISATYINYLADANIGFSSGAFTIKHIGTVGIGVRYVGYGDFNRLDENGASLGSFSANDLAISGVYSLRIAENLNAGASMDFIHASYGEYNSSALAFSGGVFYQNSEKDFSAGFSVRNAGGQINTFQERQEPLPLDVAVGISKKPEAFPFHLNLTIKKLNDWDLRTFGETESPAFLDNLMRHILLGGETSLGDNVNVRIGYDHYLHEQTKTGKTLDLAGVAFGVGFEIKSIQIDLSRNSYSKLGGITRISLKTDLN